MKNKESKWRLKKSRPELTLAFSFLIVILVGAFLLSLKVSNVNGKIDFIDALFVSTSSTCVTGLVTVTPASQFTLFGQVVILLLIQIGGLGFMTFISVLLLFMRAKLDFKEKLLLKDALNKEDFQGVGRYIKSIILYTFCFEIIGFFLIFTQLYQGENVALEAFQSLFLSISAFCNAGIDILGPSSLMIYQSNIVINLTVSALIIMGGIGFAVWFDFASNSRLFHHFKKKNDFFRRRLRINTRIVLIMTAILISSGTVLIFLTEYNNALAELSLFDKIQASFFNSVTLRTAGFFTIDYSILKDATKLVMIVFMLIGGSPGGTAGGMKTTTFFLLIYAMVSLVNERNKIRVFKREVALSNIIKAFVIFFMYMSIILIGAFTITLIDNYSFIDILFEVVSALATVGLSIGITSSLSLGSKIIIIVLMFIGRLGPITIALSLKRRAKNDKGISYPVTEIVVG